MAYPAGVSLASITTGSVTDFFGSDAAITATVTPIIKGTTHIVHAATGAVLVPSPMVFTAGQGEGISFTVPHVDQDGWRDGAGNAYKGWAYRVVVAIKSRRGQDMSWTKNVAPVLGQALIDLDLVADGQIGIPISAPTPQVLSVNGQTGAVVLETGAGDGEIAALVQDPASATGTALDTRTAALMQDGATATGAALSTTITDRLDAGIGVERPSTITFSATAPTGSTVALTPTSPVTWRGGSPLSTSNGIVSTIGGPVGIEFDVWGKTASVEIHCYSTTNRIRFYVDGKLVTDRNGDLVTGAAVGTRIWTTLTFDTDGPHRVYVNGANLAWRSLGFDATGDVAPVPAPTNARKVAILGDSWVAGALGVSSMNTWGGQVCQLLGMPEALLSGQGGTGYANPGTTTATKIFGDTGRITPIINLAPTDVIIFGSINDGTYAAATIKANAKTLYATLRAGIPGVRLHVVLPQPTTEAQQNSAGQLANRQAVREAAQETDGVYSIIDGVAAGWLTESNRPRFLGSDNSHLTQEGHDYLARRLAAALRPGLENTAKQLPVTVIASDTFTRANGALGTTETGAKTWTVSGTGRIEISGNTAVSYDQTGTNLKGGFALLDAGTANVAVQLTHISGGSGVGPAVRCSVDQGAADATGYFLESQAGVWTIYKRTSQEAFTILAASTTAPAAGQVVRLEASGSTLTAIVDGVTVATATDTAYSSNRHGFTSAYHMKAVDNFTVRAL